MVCGCWVNFDRCVLGFGSFFVWFSLGVEEVVEGFIYKEEVRDKVF